MSGIFDQIINYSPPLIVSGTVNYKGTWDASTNNPPLSNPPVASTKGDYYVVSTAGTQFSISFAVGDWIISSGTAWEKVDLTDAVSSVFGRTGAVVGVSTDYSAVGLTNTAIGASSPSTGAFTTVTASSTIAATGAVTGSNLSGTNTGDQTTITGNAGSATILQTARNINGVSFNGSADITVTAAAGTLTGATLASGVTASSLTSLGTIASLVATTADINGGTIDGTTVGASTPSTVAATTIAASGVITQTIANSGYINVNTDASNKQWRVGGGSGGIFQITEVGVADRLTITSTGLNSTAIGATTPSTGAFTTLSASGVASFSTGTNLAPSISFSGDSNTGFFNVAADTIGITTAGVYAGNFQTNSAGGGLYIQAGGTNQNIRLVPTGTGSVIVDIGGTITSTSSTGLAVTGTLGASGNVWSGNDGFDWASGTTDGSYHTAAGVYVTSVNGDVNLRVRRRTSDGAIAAFYRDTTNVGSISVTTTATAYNTSSDARLKTNVRALTGSGAIIDALKPILFDWKSGQKDSYGFIAQEAHAIFPQAVTPGDDDPDIITQQWAMDAGKFMPLVIAELQSLRARVAALESN